MIKELSHAGRRHAATGEESCFLNKQALHLAPFLKRQLTLLWVCGRYEPTTKGKTLHQLDGLLTKYILRGDFARMRDGHLAEAAPSPGLPEANTPTPAEFLQASPEASSIHTLK
jgi:hypothetical protein